MTFNINKQKIQKSSFTKVLLISSHLCSLILVLSTQLKPNACNNKARRIKFHRYVRQFLPRDHGGFGHKNQKMSDFLGIAQKVRHFLILVPKTAMISWQKLANISMELAAPNVVVIRIGLQKCRPCTLGPNILKIHRFFVVFMWILCRSYADFFVF